MHQKATGWITYLTYQIHNKMGWVWNEGIQKVWCCDDQIATNCTSFITSVYVCEIYNTGW